MVMSKANLYDANGRFVRTLEDGEEYIAKPGERLSFSYSMMDSMQPLEDNAKPHVPLHAPGYVSVADAEYQRREAMIADGKARLSSAWKNPPALDSSLAPAKPKINDTPDVRDADTAWARRNEVLQGAWR
jgi:hypothetical protein